MDQMDFASLQKMIGKAETSFPTLPTVITRLLNVLNDPESSVSDVAQVVKQDQALTTKLLRLVSSAAFGFGNQVVSVNQAIGLVGFYTVKNLFISLTIMDTLRIEAFSMHSFWLHTIATSTASHFFAERAGQPQKAELAGTLGLIHDIGKLFFISEVPVLYYQVITTIQETRELSVNVENELLGVDHCLAGSSLAQRWHWPPIYREIIMHHHTPGAATLDPVLTFCVYLGNMAAHVAYNELDDASCLSQAFTTMSTYPSLSGLIQESDWKEALEYIHKNDAETQKFVKAVS